jgi:flavorubredoxin
VKQIETHLAACNIPLAVEGVRAKWQPTAADLQNCETLGCTSGPAQAGPDALL